MPIPSAEIARIAVVGLGYVGLPLVVALSRRFAVTGFDVDGERIAELKNGCDRTREVSEPVLRACTSPMTDDVDSLAGNDVFIVTVPTPVDEECRPDLRAVVSACRTVGRFVRPDTVGVFESTVNPGLPEDNCGPELEAVSGLVA